MSKTIPNQDQNQLDNISPSRYISAVKPGAGRRLSSKIETAYISEGGLLFRADCLDLLTTMREGSVDLVFVDPPFNLGKDYETDFSDDLETEAYRIWCRSWLIELARVLKPGGALFLYHWPKWLIEFGAWLNTFPAMEYKSWIALKMKGGFPIRGRIHPAHYGLLYYVKRGGKPTFNVVRAKSPTCRHCGKLVRDYGGYRKKFQRFEDEDGIPWVQISDFWEDTRPARQDKSRGLQINELPLHIPERAILMASNPGDIVLDCFVGGGSTLHAAHLHERLWIGGELGEPKAALQRIATFIGEQETVRPSKRLINCFADGLLQTELNLGPNGHKRPVSSVGKLQNVTGSMEQFASKSKVIGF